MRARDGRNHRITEHEVPDGIAHASKLNGVLKTRYLQGDLDSELWIVNEVPSPSSVIHSPHM